MKFRCVFRFSKLIKKNRSIRAVFYAPTEIRTLVLALKGLRPSPLDDGGVLAAAGILSLHA